MKLKIGDKIKWNVPIGGDVIYTIIDIDTSRDEIEVIPDLFLKSEVLYQWEDDDGTICQGWGHSYDDLNDNLLRGGISILNGGIEPYKCIKKFKL